jgi:tRNA(fMet)-specific endonuclease VapC
MPKYLLDTNACIGLRQQMKGKPPRDAARAAAHEHLVKRLQATPAGELAMSVITLGELRYGAQKSADPAAGHHALERLQELVPVLDLHANAASRYGEVRSALEQAGTPIGPQDLWIAAHALAEDLTVVTHNTREFARVPGLRVEDWTTA